METFLIECTSTLRRGFARFFIIIIKTWLRARKNYRNFTQTSACWKNFYFFVEGFLCPLLWKRFSHTDSFKFGCIQFFVKIHPRRPPTIALCTSRGYNCNFGSQTVQTIYWASLTLIRPSSYIPTYILIILAH